MVADTFTEGTHVQIVHGLAARLGDVETSPPRGRADALQYFGTLLGLGIAAACLPILVGATTPGWLQLLLAVASLASLALGLAWPTLWARRGAGWYAAQNDTIARVTREVIAGVQGPFTGEERERLAALFAWRLVKVKREGWLLSHGEITLLERQAARLAVEREPGMRQATLASEADRRARRRGARYIPVYVASFLLITLGCAVLYTPLGALVGIGAGLAQLVGGLALIAVGIVLMAITQRRVYAIASQLGRNQALRLSEFTPDLSEAIERHLVALVREDLRRLHEE